MKKLLYLVLKGNAKAFETLDELKKGGFNATIASAESLKKAISLYPEEHHFFNLRHLEDINNSESVLGLFVIDEDRLEEAKNIVRNNTENFTLIKGFMFSVDLLDYEGSI